MREIAARTGMLAVGTTTGPLVGPRRLRDALAARNPDLWRTHEGNANLLLVGPALSLVPGSARAVRLNPPAAILRAAVDLAPRGGRAAALPARAAQSGDRPRPHGRRGRGRRRLPALPQRRAARS